MTEKAVLRIYLPASAKITGPRTFWQKLFGPSLGGFILKNAKEFGIEQAIFQRVMGGYLKGKNLAYEQGEVIPPDFPQCVELIDKEDTIKRFLNVFRAQLNDCRIILLHAQELAGSEWRTNAPLA